MALGARWLGDTLALYRRVFARGAALVAANLPVGLVVVVYATLLGFGMLLAAPLGFLGGFLVYLVAVACMSSWLALVEEVIRHGRVRLADLPAGFSAYLGDLLTVAFILWGLDLIATLVLTPAPALLLVFKLAALAFFNAVPELIYLGRHGAAELLVESYRFIGENWVEWFPPNLFLIALLVAVVQVVPSGPYGLFVTGASGIVLYFAMIVRGLLFMELAYSTRRSREFRRRSSE
jgi:hypothetical protein